MKELCPDCQPYGKCLFDEYANSIVAELKAKDISNPEILLSVAIEVHQKIADERIVARKKMCPNLNNINPDYPGKEPL